MAKLNYDMGLDPIELNYYGPTLYIKTRTGRAYSCYPHMHTLDKQGRIEVESFPGYERYKGFATLTPEEADRLGRLCEKARADKHPFAR